MTHQMQRIKEAFHKNFPGRPKLVQSPGRVNLIGEHTDYNEGFVLPAAIDKSIYFAVAPRTDQTCRFFSVDLNEHYQCVLSELKPSDRRWPNYLTGVLNQMVKRDILIKGIDCAFGGDIPIGAGLSSSAAIEAGFAFSLDTIFGLGIDRMTLAKLAQQAEHEFAGVRCGIMDQFANLFGHSHAALKLDCRSLDHDIIPFMRDDIRIVLCDTGVRHDLAASEYNVRRQQCEAGVKDLQRNHPAIHSLRDVSLALLQETRRTIDPIVYRRCHYVICENARVIDACADLLRNDIAAFGRKMFQSHEGLRDEYDVSCKELDILVENAGRLHGVLGSRMMGGGFGGCTINLVDAESLEEFSESIGDAYQNAAGKALKIYVCSICDGTHIITDDV